MKNPESKLSKLANRLPLVTRFVLALGMGSLAVATYYASVTTPPEAIDVHPDWFSEPIYRSCLFLAMMLAILWGVVESILRNTQSANWRYWMLSVTLAAIISPCFYVLPAAIWGQEVAKFDTWHLLPLFALVHGVIFTVVGSIIGGIFVLVISLLMKAPTQN